MNGARATEDECYDAIEAGDVARLRLLLRDGVDVHSRHSLGSTPLHCAAKFGHAAVVRLLLTHGADVDARIHDGDTPLHCAVRHGHEHIAEMLLDASADVNAENAFEQTPLYQAALGRSLGIVRLLLDRGAVVNAKGYVGYTALHGAAARSSVDVVQLLLERGADVQAEAIFGKRPLHDAAMYGKRDVVCVLLEHGADIDALDHYGKTALHYAAYKGEIETIALLVERGASTSARDKDGKLPLDHLLERELGVVLSSVLSSVRSNGVEGQRLWQQLMKPSSESGKVAVIRRCLELWRRQSDDATELTEIPFEVTKEGAASVEMYISALAVSGSTTYRHKICVVGPTTAGKTSLIKSLTRGESTLEKMDTRTVGIDLFSHRFESRDGLHEVTLWDFAGQDIYHAAHAMFFTRRTLFLLAVDLSKYAAALPDENERQQTAEPRIKRFVDEYVLHWLRLILTRLPDATIAIVGTKTDLVAVAMVEDIRMDLEQRVACWCEEQHALQKMSDDGQEPTPISTMKHQSRVSWLDTRELLTAAVRAWITMSSADNHSIQETRTRLEQLIIAQGRGFLMPDAYSSVLERVRRRRDASGASLSAQVRSMFVRKHELLEWLTRELPTLRQSSCTLVMRTLHELGDVLWYNASQVTCALQEQACLAPDLVINLVREIVSHELFELMQGAANSSDGGGDDDAQALTARHQAYRTIRNNARFVAWQQQLLGSGCVDGTLITMLPLWKDVTEPDAFVALKGLLQHLGLAYPVGNTDDDNGGMTPESSLIVPAYWKMHDAVSRDSRDLDLVTHLRLSTTRSALLHEYAWEYEFYASFFPPTLFEKVVVSSFTPSAKRIVTTPERVVAAVRDESVVRLEILGNMHRKRLLRVEAVAVTQELAQRLVLYHCVAVEAALAEYRGLNPIVQLVRREDSQTEELAEEQRQRLLQDAVTRFPRLCDSVERPTTLFLQIQVADLSWGDAKLVHAPAFCCRDREIPPLDKLQTEWSLQTIDERNCWKAARTTGGQVVIHIRDVPAVPVLKTCTLRVVVKRCRRFLRPSVLACGSLRLDRIIPDESLGVFQVADVKMRLTGELSRKTQVIGQLTCSVACIADHKDAIAA